MKSKIVIKESNIHPHLQKRMIQRGISREEIEIAINEGWRAEDAKEGTAGKVYVFQYNNYWLGSYFEEKEVTIYYRYKNEKLILLTAKARYGKDFKEGERKE